MKAVNNRPMNNLPKKCLLDTNVPITANYRVNSGNPAGGNSDNLPDGLTKDCVRACVEAVEHVVKNGGLVLDSGGEIFKEYLKNLSDTKHPHNLSRHGHPGVGNKFMMWVHKNRWNPKYVDVTTISRNGDSYNEFPPHPGLSSFDNSDRKFVATANAHRDNPKPPILQATDSKWWGWKDALAASGITAHFLCPEYIKNKYAKKMEPSKSGP
jgi:hypothetical protein